MQRSIPAKSGQSHQNGGHSEAERYPVGAGGGHRAAEEPREFQEDRSGRSSLHASFLFFTGSFTPHRLAACAHADAPLRMTPFFDAIALPAEQGHGSKNRIIVKAPNARARLPPGRILRAAWGAAMNTPAKQMIAQKEFRGRRGRDVGQGFQPVPAARQADRIRARRPVAGHAHHPHGPMPSSLALLPSGTGWKPIPHWPPSLRLSG